jgi:hypothetical protein
MLLWKYNLGQPLKIVKGMNYYVCYYKTQKYTKKNMLLC